MWSAPLQGLGSPFPTSAHLKFESIHTSRHPNGRCVWRTAHGSCRSPAPRSEMPQSTSLRAALHQEGRSGWGKKPASWASAWPPSLLCGFPHSLIVTLRQSFTVGPACGQPVRGKSWVSNALDIRIKETAQLRSRKRRKQLLLVGCLIESAVKYTHNSA